MLRHWRPVNGSGVVDEDVDGAIELLNTVEEPWQCITVAEVGGHRPESPAGRLDAAAGFPAVGLERDADPDHVSPGPGQCLRDRQADAAAGARDDGEPASEPEERSLA